MQAVLTMLGLLAGLSISLPFLTTLLCFWIPYHFWHWMPEAGNSLTAVLLLGVPAFAGGVLGRKRPKYAVSGAFYATIALTLVPLVTSLGSIPWTHDFWPTGEIALWAGSWLASGCGAAYLGGRGKAGRFRLSDLRLRRQ
jgi:hypothetical protein